MEIQREFRCMRCGHEFTAVHTKDGELVERTCPKCRSNSIRELKENAQESSASAKQN
ncbi:MAG: zinc ribbon domain-containing protein [Candidatus Eisenbacteria sp.]|nr:zinc ribbon domain-containing protein [Candidatus Eisenbacteria bacterium]